MEEPLRQVLDAEQLSALADVARAGEQAERAGLADGDQSGGSRSALAERIVIAAGLGITADEIAVYGRLSRSLDYDVLGFADCAGGLRLNFDDPGASVDDE